MGEDRDQIFSMVLSAAVMVSHQVYRSFVG